MFALLGLCQMADDRKVAVREGQRIQVQAQWSNADHLDPVFADNLHVMRLNEQFYLTFGQIRLPMTEAQDSMVGELRTMVRLVVPKDALQRTRSTIPLYFTAAGVHYRWQASWQYSEDERSIHMTAFGRDPTTIL